MKSQEKPVAELGSIKLTPSTQLTLDSLATQLSDASRRRDFQRLVPAGLKLIRDSTRIYERDRRQTRRRVPDFGAELRSGNMRFDSKLRHGRKPPLHVQRAQNLVRQAGNELLLAAKLAPDRHSGERLRFLALGLRQLCSPLSVIARSVEGAPFR